MIRKNRKKALPASSPSEGGFTLLEVLVALVLTALLSAGLATAIQTARRVLVATERNATASDVLAAQGFLRASLASAFRVPAAPAHQDDLTFSGTGTRLTFATGYVPKALHQGLYRLDIALVPSGLGGGLWDLVAHERPSRVAPGEITAPLPPRDQTSSIIRGIAAAKFAYFGKPELNAPQDIWLDQWSVKDASPRLVRLDIAFPPGDTRIWPTLLMPLEQSAP